MMAHCPNGDHFKVYYVDELPTLRSSNEFTIVSGEEEAVLFFVEQMRPHLQCSQDLPFWLFNLIDRIPVDHAFVDVAVLKAHEMCCGLIKGKW